MCNLYPDFKAHLEDLGSNAVWNEEGLFLSVTLPPTWGLCAPIHLSEFPSEKILLQILYVADIAVPCHRRPELFRFIHLLNKVSLFPGFGFDEVDDAVFFRYSIPFNGEDAKDTAVFAIQMIAQQISAYQNSLFAIACEDKSLEQVLNDNWKSQVLKEAICKF